MMMRFLFLSEELNWGNGAWLQGRVEEYQWFVGDYYRVKDQVPVRGVRER